MNVAEMIDAAINSGADGQAVLDMLIEYGHMPLDANTRPAEQTAREVEAFYAVRKLLVDG